MPNTEQLLCHTEKSSHQRFSVETMFLKFLQYSWENACMKFLRMPILKNICVWLLLNGVYEVIVWNFVSGLHLKPSWLTFKTKFDIYAIYIFNPYAFLWT